MLGPSPEGYTGVGSELTAASYTKDAKPILPHVPVRQHLKLPQADKHGILAPPARKVIEQESREHTGVPNKNQ